MVEHQPSKLDTWVRFPSPAFFNAKKQVMGISIIVCDAVTRFFYARKRGMGISIIVCDAVTRFFILEVTH